MERISRRDVIKTGGMLSTAAVLSGSGVVSTSGHRCDAEELAVHREGNVLVKSINFDPKRIPTMYGRLFNRKIAFLSAAFPNVQGLRLDACAFEPADGMLRLDLLGLAVPDDNQIVLSHRVRKYPSLVHVTTFTASTDGIEVVGRLAVDKKARVGDVKVPDTMLSPNLCCCFQKSPNFVAGGMASPPYGEAPNEYPNWVSRCFIFTEQGRTFLNNTDRQKSDEVPASDPRNNPVWAQNYVGVWQSLNGESMPANTSHTRYVVPLMGAVSNDGKYLVALVSDSPRYIAQPWHTCMHHIVSWLPNGAPMLERQWRMKLYAMANEPILLMTRVSHDFPNAMRLKDHAVAGS